MRLYFIFPIHHLLWLSLGYDDAYKVPASSIHPKTIQCRPYVALYDQVQSPASQYPLADSEHNTDVSEDKRLLPCSIVRRIHVAMLCL
jgi:hypothetical protein